MSRSEIGRRRVMQGAALAGAAAAGGAPTGTAIAQNRPVQMISHRYPALEHWAAKMKTAIPGQEVNTQLMPFDKALELLTIALSAKADTVAAKRFEVAYNRYVIGRFDMDNLYLAQNEKNQALSQYLQSLRGFWLAYYRLRRVTLYDFASGTVIR